MMKVKRTLRRAAAAALCVLLCGGSSAFAAHTHRFGGWEYEDKQTHLGYCLVAGCRETCLEPHDYAEDASAYIAPTEEQEGRKIFRCAQCGDLIIEAIPKLPHTAHDFDSVYIIPTCTEDGFWEYTCSVCGLRRTEPGEAALGHDYSIKIATVMPTGSREGYSTYKCARCGETQTRPIPRIVPGDADGNGAVNLRDVAALRRALAGWEVTIVVTNCDVNVDGSVDLMDSALLLRWLAGGWNVELV